MRSVAQRVSAFTEDERFLVHNRKEVARILGDLAKQKMVLNASFNHGLDKMFTSVISVDYDMGTAYLDVGASDTANRNLLTSHDVVFSSTSGVKIQWSSCGIDYVNLKDGRAFKIDFPKDLIRVQRREYYRLATPVVSLVKCSIPVEDRMVEVALIDLCANGISATAMDPLDEILIEGTEFHNCRIDFPDVGTTDLTLRIGQIVPIEQKNSAVKHRLGMEFVNPSRGNQALIQRYMGKLEREFMALVKDR